VLKGLTAIFFGQVLVIAGNLLLVPLYLAHWSTAVYGEWLALFSLVLYLSTLDLGMQQAVVNRLTQAYIRGNLEQYADYQHSAMAFYILLAAGGSLLLALAAWLLSVPTWIGLREMSSSDAAWVMWLLGIQILWAMPAGLVCATYRTTGDLATNQWVTNVQRLATLVLMAVMLVFGGDPKTIALIQLAPPLLMVALVWRDLQWRFPRLTLGISRASLPIVRELILPSLLFFAIMVSLAITQQGPVLILTSALGGAAVTLFVTSRTLANLVRQIVGSFTNALWPDLTAMEARQEHERLRSVHSLLAIGSTTFCIAVASTLWYEGGEVITVWTGGKLKPDVILLRLLLIQLVLQSPMLASGIFSAAASRHAKLARSNLVSSVVGITATALLMGRLGMWAVPVGLLFGEALAQYHFVVKDTCEMIGEPYGPFARRLWFGLIAVGAVSLGAGWCAHRIAWGPALLRWLEVGALTCAATLSVAWCLWLQGELRSQIVDRLRFTRRWAGLWSFLLGR
jgi:O-antigen/teichoic acid export membrane protein